MSGGDYDGETAVVIGNQDIVREQKRYQQARKSDALRAARPRATRVQEISRVMRAIDTANGQLSVDLIVKVEGADRLLTSDHRTWKCNSNTWSLLECAALGRSSQCGTRGPLGLTAQLATQRKRLMEQHFRAAEAFWCRQWGRCCLVEYPP